MKILPLVLVLMMGFMSSHGVARDGWENDAWDKQQQWRNADSWSNVDSWDSSPAPAAERDHDRAKLSSEPPNGITPQVKGDDQQGRIILTLKQITLIKAEAYVKVKFKGDEEWQAAKEEMGLRPGDELRTSAGTAVSLVFFNGPSWQLLSLNDDGHYRVGSANIFQIFWGKLRALVHGLVPSSPLQPLRYSLRSAGTPISFSSADQKEAEVEVEVYSMLGTDVMEIGVGPGSSIRILTESGQTLLLNPSHKVQMRNGKLGTPIKFKPTAPPSAPPV